MGHQSQDPAEQDLARESGGAELGGEPVCTEQLAAARLGGYYDRIQERWATHLLTDSLFEPTPLELDRRARTEYLVEVLAKLRSESERRRARAPSGRRGVEAETRAAGSGSAG